MAADPKLDALIPAVVVEIHFREQSQQLNEQERLRTSISFLQTSFQTLEKDFRMDQWPVNPVDTSVTH